MEFSIKQVNLENLEKTKHDCIVIGIFESYCMSTIAEQIDKISSGYISKMIHRSGLEGKIGQTMLLHYIPNIMSERILLIGCGKKDELHERQYKQIINKTIKVLNNITAKEVILFLIDLQLNEKRSFYWKVRQAVEITQETMYTFTHMKSNKTELPCKSLRKIIFNISTHDKLINGENAILHGLAIAAGIKSAKDLGNMPPNICNTTYLDSQAYKLANQQDINNKNINVFTISEQKMKELGMHAYTAVGQGSPNESLMSIITYNGSPNVNTRPIVLIGKGLTFDSGGISIKSADKMDEMKYDMCGAAAVYGVMHTAIELNLPLNIIGVLASCENMVDGHAFRPGDVLTTLSGQTVEILNTDAEGRLVLCDVLTYVERFNPEVVIDIATLTGACVIALGHHITGLMSNDDSLAHELIDAAEQAADRIWRLPLGDEFQEQLESNIADIANIGGKSASAITAGCFLSRFTLKYKWAHLDIAGTAWYSGKHKGATGRPVAMLSQFLLNRAGFNV